MAGPEKCIGWKRNTEALLVAPVPSRSATTAQRRRRIAIRQQRRGHPYRTEGRREAPKGSGVLKAERLRALLCRGRMRCVPSGQTLWPEMGPRRRPKAVEGVERAAKGRPEKKITERPCRVRNLIQQQTARRRRQRLFFGVSEWRCGPRAAAPRKPRKGA